MEKIKNITIPRAKEKLIALDLFFTDGFPKPIVIYAHGFNGFKDWGNFDLIAEQFVRAGFTFLKFNFSHNGTTPEAPEEFVDLDAYAENNYTTELLDLEKVIDWAVDEKNPYNRAIDPDQLFLLGHSMGGGIVLVKAAEDSRIAGVATWASVGALTTPWGKWPADKIEQWRDSGVAHIKNSRTKQDMPLGFQLYEDFQDHKERLDVENAVKNAKVPILLCHGTDDDAVPVETASRLAACNDHASVYIVESDHVFGRRHPWTESNLPEATLSILRRTIDFFSTISTRG